MGSGAIGLGLGMPTSPCEELVFQEPEPGITNAWRPQFSICSPHAKDQRRPNRSSQVWG